MLPHLGLCRVNALGFAFIIFPVHSAAPSPGNLFNWGPENNPSTANCSAAGALSSPVHSSYILSTVMLVNGWIWWSQTSSPTLMILWFINQKSERSVSEGVQAEKHREKRPLDFSAPVCPVRNSFHTRFQLLLLGKKGHSPKAWSLQWVLCKLLLISICQTAASKGQCGNVSSFSRGSLGWWIMLGTGQTAAGLWHSKAS